MRRWVDCVGIILLDLGIVFTCLGIFVWGDVDIKDIINNGQNDDKGNNDVGGENTDTDNKNDENNGNVGDNENEDTENKDDGNDVFDEEFGDVTPQPPESEEKPEEVPIVIDTTLISSSEINLASQTAKIVTIDCSKEFVGVNDGETVNFYKKITIT